MISPPWIDVKRMKMVAKKSLPTEESTPATGTSLKRG
jgi:hypothetical protein